MNLRAIIRKLTSSFNHREELPNEAVAGLVRVLECAREDEATCAEVYERIDEYVEREVDKKDAADLMPVIRDHLDLCHECCEEYEALLDVLEKTSREQE